MLSARMKRALLPAPRGLLGAVVFFILPALVPEGGNSHFSALEERRGVGKGSPAASVGDCSSHCQS